jgi:hypothetical protein
VREAVEFLKELQPVLLLLMGWAMGLLSPGIVERIRRKYRQRDVMQAVIDELHGLRFTMMWVAYTVRAHNCKVTDEFLDNILPIIDAYHGPDRDERSITSLKESRQRAETERAAIHQTLRKPGVVGGVRQYSLPLFVTQLADLAICSLPFQRAVLNVRYHLDLFNQIAARVQTWNDKTVTGLDEPNHAVAVNNADQEFRAMGARAEIVINAINNLTPSIT